jgi:hypothetical protein
MTPGKGGVAFEINNRAKFERALLEDGSGARLGALALCPVVLGIFEAIARFFFFGVGHFLLDAEGRKEKGRGERGKGGQMNDATLGGYIAKCAVSFKVRCMVQVGCPRKAI